MSTVRTGLLRALCVLAMTAVVTACADSTVYTNADKTAQTTTSISADAGTATVTKDAFLFASPYPARIIIPDIDGMNGTAFIVSTMSPAGVLAIDLDSTPIQLSKTFKGVVSPDGTGLPNNLAIQSATRAVMLTSSHLIDFNPTSGAIRSTVALPKSITLPQSMPLSGPLDYDNDGIIDTHITEVPLAFPGGILVTGSSIWITTANYLRYTSPAVAAPGLLLHYTSTGSGISATPTVTVTSGFNPTGIAQAGNSLLVTNSGVITISGGEAQPQTPSSVDMVDMTTGAITATIPADLSALAFFAPAVDAEGRFAYYGSSAFSEVYQLDVANKTFTRNLLNPIILGGANAADFLTAIALTPDGGRAYVGSFDLSRVFLLDITAAPIVPLPTSYVVGFPKGVSAENPSGVNTGISDMTTRPGTTDLFVLTGNPGTLITITAQGNAAAPVAGIHAIRIAPSLLTLEVGKKSILTGDILFADGRQIVNVRDQFTIAGTTQQQTLQWSSDNPKVATISASGLVTGVSGGITTIHARVGAFSASIPVAIHLGEAPLTPPPADKPPSDPSSGESSPPPPDESGKLIVVNCKDIGASPFIEQVVSATVGASGGANQSKLPDIVYGVPHGGGMNAGGVDTFSLGDKGSIIVAFDSCWVADGPGTDFIVFENAFNIGGTTTPFSEPGIVGVSMDGVTYTDFPCELSQSPLFPGCAGTHPVLSNPNNAIDPLDPTTAGGDPFDLSVIGAKTARFIRIVDQGLTPFKGANGTNGFDLDAIAIVHGTKPKQ